MACDRPELSTDVECAEVFCNGNEQTLSVDVWVTSPNPFQRVMRSGKALVRA